MLLGVNCKRNINYHAESEIAPDHSIDHLFIPTYTLRNASFDRQRKLDPSIKTNKLT